MGADHSLCAPKKSAAEGKGATANGVLDKIRAQDAEDKARLAGDETQRLVEQGGDEGEPLEQFNLLQLQYIG